MSNRDVVKYRLHDGSMIGNPISKICPLCNNDYLGYSYSEKCHTCWEIEYNKAQLEQKEKYIKKEHSHKIGSEIVDEKYGKLIVAEADYGCNGCFMHNIHVEKVKTTDYITLFDEPEFCRRIKCDNVIFIRK